jgi:hypothetical protein
LGEAQCNGGRAGVAGTAKHTWHRAQCGLELPRAGLAGQPQPRRAYCSIGRAATAGDERVAAGGGAVVREGGAAC